MKRLALLLVALCLPLSVGAQDFVALAKKMVPTVVNIFTTTAMKPQWRGRSDPSREMWHRFFEEYFGGSEPYGGGGPPNGPGGRAQSLGSGFVIESSNGTALIMTNNHVVDGADEVKVKFTESNDEKATSAEVVGRDTDLDVALLKVKTSRPLAVATLGDSDQLEQGEWVMAIGNPFGHGHSVAKGIVSAKERTLPGSYSQYLQVDAPINPGNSGGPLSNMNGEVVGINNAVLINAQGIGFAIPINLVKKVLPQLKAKGSVDRGYLGINIEDLRPDLAKGFKADENLKAPFVTNVIKGGPGDRAGIMAYDIILQINGKPIKDTLELVNTITALSAGEKVQLNVQRQGKVKTITATVGKRPSERPGVLSEGPDKKGARIRMKLDPSMQLETLDDEYRRELGLADKTSGVVVLNVSFGGPADEAGLQRGDVILEVDRKPITNVQGFFARVTEKKSYLLRVMRASEQPGEEEFLVVTLDLSEKANKTEE